MEKIGRRKFVNRFATLGVGSLITWFSIKNKLLANTLTHFSDTFSLPLLPYDYNSLEPFIDKETMQIHHSKHHLAYVTNLNKLVISENIKELDIAGVLSKVDNYPVGVRNNAGGHYNHSLFWKLLTPVKEQNAETFKINTALVKQFGTMENFKAEFEKKALSVFGSGWTWLILNSKKELEIITTSNQDNPLMPNVAKNAVILLALDVWEHAYYLKYQNKRADYLKAWWQLVNWQHADQLFANT